MSDTYTDYGVDPDVEELRAPSDAIETQVARIRTSDRITFKRCRRKWGWNSHLRGNLGPKEAQNPLWFGTGMHFALEDYHGYNIYGSPTEAFKAYCSATYFLKQQTPIPAMYPELRELGIGMMDYYSLWLSERDKYRTFWFNGIPQVEVRAHVEIPFDPKSKYPSSPYDKAVYSVTIDRVVEDEDGQIWLVDYKSAKQIQTMHYATDPQIGAYYWVAGYIYDKPIAGFIYQQHRKDIPQTPRVTSLGRLSTDKRQLVTHASYRKVLVNIFGPNAEKWPSENLTFLNFLAQEEGPDADKFIRRDKVYRNQYSFQSEGTKILLEVEDMLNPDLPLYPNPTRDCAYMCPFMHACLSLDDGSDYEYELSLAHASRGPENDQWRLHLPPTPPTPPTSNPTPQNQQSQLEPQVPQTIQIQP